MTSQVKRLLVHALKSIEQEMTPPPIAQRPKSRIGKKTVAGHFAPETAWQLKKLALDRGMTVQAILEEAVADLFDKYHLPRI